MAIVEPLCLAEDHAEPQLQFKEGIEMLKTTIMKSELWSG